MTITEKAAYLKGLVEGQGLDPEFGEGKLWHVLSELVGDLAAAVTDLQQENESFADSLEEIEVNLDYLEDVLLDGTDEDGESWDDEDENVYSFSGSVLPFDDGEEDPEEDAEDGDPEDDEDDDDGIYYEVECPNCGEEISFDEETLEEGTIFCPNCGAQLEFDTREPADEDAEPAAPADDGEED